MKKYLVYLLLSMVVISLPSYLSKKEEVLTVNKTERIEGRYLIFTDQGVYENTDSSIHFKRDSSDLYAKLSKHGSFTCTTNWFRVPLFSMYRNILECK